MKLVPNLSPPMRVFYAIGSAALIVIPLLATMETWLRIALPVCGTLGLITAASGW